MEDKRGRQGMDDAGRWREAWLARRHDAAIGRHFRGIIHNLNGVAQAFSMQAELLTMMFDRALAILDGLDGASPDAMRARLDELAGLLRKREGLPRQMAEKVVLFQSIVGQVLAPGTSCDMDEKKTAGLSADVNAAIRGEMDFLLGDPFFKHRVEKRLALADRLPAAAMPEVGLRHLLALLLENALDASRDSAVPEISVATSVDNGKLRLVIENAGSGLGPEIREMAMEPFFSTRPGHAGLGLYLARNLVEAHGGSLTLEEGDGCVRAVVELPAATGGEG